MTLTNCPTAADVHMDNGLPTANRDTLNVQVGESNVGSNVRRSLIKPDLSSIAAGQIISACTLKLIVFADASDNARTMYAYRLKQNWVEAQATWNVYSTGNNWQTAGAIGANDIDATAIGSAAVPASMSPGDTLSIGIDPAVVQDWLDGVLSNYGVLLKVDTESNDLFSYYDSENATPSNRPVWDITHASPVTGTPWAAYAQQ